MVALFLFILFGLAFGYFSTLNTQLVSINVGGYVFDHTPLYAVILASFAIGVLFSTIFYLLKSLSAGFTIRKKESKLDSVTKENAELLRKVHKLELENTRLKTENGEESDDDKSL